jgi:hypothetical protein
MPIMSTRIPGWLATVDVGATAGRAAYPNGSVGR